MISGIFKEGFIYAFSDSIRKLSPFFLLPVYISSLSLSEFGRLEYITILSSLFSYLIGWGSVQGLLRYYEKDKKYAVSASISIITFIFVIVLLILNLLDYFFKITVLLDITTVIMNSCILYGFILSINNLSLTILRFEQRLIEYGVVNLSFVITQIVLIYYFLIYLDFSFLAKIFGLIITNLVLLPILLIYILRSKINFTFSFEIHKSILSFYSPITFSNLLGWGSGSIDKVAIKAFLGDEQLGIYSFVLQLAQIFKLGVESFLKSVNVLIYKNLDKISFFIQSRMMFIAIFHFSAFLYFTLIIFLQEKDLFMNYPVPISLFVILILSRVILLSNFMEVIFFYAKTDSKSVTISNFISFIFLVLIVIPSVTIFGLEGVAISLFLYAIINYIILNFLHKSKKRIIFFNSFLLVLPLALLLINYV
jgi:O-antigen/teichoic acid export membrane protein